MDKFYLTTTLPYVNAEAHLGHAQEFVYADIIARYQKSLGKEIFFNTGTDEHGAKIYKKALEEKKESQYYVDEYAEKFKKLMPVLGMLTELHFIRTTDKNHISACQEFWKRCEKNKDIYKQIYRIKYCVGCELEKNESELIEGKCPIHPNLEIEIIEEENYFFRLSKYQERLLEYYEKNPKFVVPDFRFNEIINFVKSGLKDFSVSRLKDKMPWGVPIPKDDTQVMYVWFDALIGYISTLGWPDDEQKFSDFWGTVKKPNAIQIAGKDNLRQQSAMWQAMLMSAGLPNSKQIIIHGFINSGGQKMSKSLGNVADPYEILENLESKGLTKEQAVDSLRFYLAHEITTFEDGDYTWEKLKESYNANLANGLGNFFERIFTMILNYAPVISEKNIDENIKKEMQDIEITFKHYLNNYDIFEATRSIFGLVKKFDQYINEKEPWKLYKENNPDLPLVLNTLFLGTEKVSELISPIMPEKSLTVKNYIQKIKNNQGNKNEKMALFPRIDS